MPISRIPADNIGEAVTGFLTTYGTLVVAGQPHDAQTARDVFSGVGEIVNTHIETVTAVVLPVQLSGAITVTPRAPLTADLSDHLAGRTIVIDLGKLRIAREELSLSIRQAAFYLGLDLIWNDLSALDT